MESNLLDRMLNAYVESQTPVTITLQNKIRVSGRIRAFDSYVIVVEGPRREIVYRHAVSCVAAVSVHEPRRTASGMPHGSAKPSPRVSKPSAPPRAKRTPVPTAMAASNDTNINTTMKDALLKWMQEQKSVK